MLAALAFGMSGAFIKPLLEAGWSPGRRGDVPRALGGGRAAPVAIVALRGNWDAALARPLARRRHGIHRGRRHAARVLRGAAAHPGRHGDPRGVHGARAVGAFVWATSRRIPKAVVLIGSVVSIAGLVLVVSPGVDGALDLLG